MTTKKTTKTKAQSDKTKKIPKDGAAQPEAPQTEAATPQPAQVDADKVAAPLLPEPAQTATETSGKTKRGAKTKAAKAKEGLAGAETKTTKLSALDAAARILTETGQ